MKQQKVVMVHLRRPWGDEDKRGDPFWEFGSFGITGCHHSNVMNPKKAHELLDARLAFAQGGPNGMRLVFLSPPIMRIRRYKREGEDLVEARWHPKGMPFKYDHAPLLIDRDGRTDFPRLKVAIRDCDRRTWIAKFSSTFRSRRKFLGMNQAKEIVRKYEQRRRKASAGQLAKKYEQALPAGPKMIDSDRKNTYSNLYRRAGKPLREKDRCGKRTKNRCRS